MWEIVEIIANILGILGAAFALFAWINTQILKKNQEKEISRLMDPITIELRSGKQKYELPVPIPRKEFSRIEVLGRIGMIPMRGAKQERYKLGFLSDPKFIQEVYNISKGSELRSLIISCTDDEFDQFNFS